MNPKKFALISGALLAAATTFATAATISASSDAPLSAYISQPNFAGGIDGGTDYSDNSGPPGQIFTVGASNIFFEGVTVKGNGSAGSMNEGNRYWVLTISSVSGDGSNGSVLTRVAQEITSSFYQPDNSTDYITITLDSSVMLLANGLYAFDIYTTDNNDLNFQSPNGGFFGFAKSDSDAYPGGAAINHNGGPGFARFAIDPGNVANTQGVDRTFFIHASVPEPSTCLLLAFGGMAGLFLRRRRMAAA